MVTVSMRLESGPLLALCVLLAHSCLAQNPPAAGAPELGSVRGKVTDASGSVVAGAIIMLAPEGSQNGRTSVTDQDGSFHFTAVEPGRYSLTIVALGFADHAMDVSVVAGENPELPPAVLQVATAKSTVQVGLSPRELAVEQVHQEEKQRILGVFPNFLVTYQANAAPLTAAEKLQLGWKIIVDPEVLIGTAATAGIEQARNSYHEFGQGMEGYGKRLGAAYADQVSGVFIGRIVTQTVFHQDPRYFFKSDGSFGARLLYAIGTAFVTKGDNGRWQPDYSDVIGGLAAGEISTLYYPASSRTGLRLFHNVLLGFGGRASAHIVQQFLYSKLTTHMPKIAAHLKLDLTDGTPVSLISVEDLRSGTLTGTRPVTFVLAKNLEVDGVVVAKEGSKAMGEVTYSSTPPTAAGGAESVQMALENVSLQAGNIMVPLRSSPKKGGPAALEYHWVEDTGRIAVTLYAAQNVKIVPTQ
jgi:hypothetical protein